MPAVRGAAGSDRSRNARFACDDRRSGAASCVTAARCGRGAPGRAWATIAVLARTSAGDDPKCHERRFLEHATQAVADGDFQLAAQIYNEVLEVAPDNLPALAGLARCYAQEGQADQARAVLAKVPAKDKGNAWTGWMVRSEPLAKPDANCDATALARNTEFGRKHKITGTPTLVFTDGSRVPGAIAAAEIEKLLANGGK